MNDVKSACRALLLANNGYAAVTTRVYDNLAPQGAKLPFSVIKLTDEKSANHLGGSTGYVNSKMEVYHYTTAGPKDVDRDNAAKMTYYSRAALNGYSGTVTIAVGQTFTIRDSTLVGAASEPNGVVENIDTGEMMLRTGQLFDIWHKE